MRQLLSIVGFVLLFILACSNPEKVPDDIFPKKKMENILWDMLLADRYAAMSYAKDTVQIKVKLETMKLYEEVFAINKVSRTDFIKSYKYYLNRPDLTRDIFDSLSTRANRSRQELFKKNVQ